VSPNGAYVALVCGSRLQVRDAATGAAAWSAGIRRHVSRVAWCGDDVVVQDTSGIVVVLRSDGSSVALSDGRVAKGEGDAPVDAGDGHVFTLGWGRSLARWRLSDGSLVAVADAPGERLWQVVGVRDGEVWVWSIPSAGNHDHPTLRRWPLSLAAEGRRAIPMLADRNADVAGVAEEGLWVRTTGGQATAYTLFDPHTGAPLRSVAFPSTGIRAGQLSPDGRKLLWVEGERVRWGALEDDAERGGFRWPGVRSACWGPDSASVWVAGARGSTRVALGDEPPELTAVDPHTLTTFAELFAAWDAEAIEDENVVKRAYDLLYDAAWDAARTAELPEPVRAVVLTEHLERHVDSDGLEMAAHNFSDHLPLAADAWRFLGLDACADVWREVALAIRTEAEDRRRRGQEREETLSEHGAAASERRAMLLREHRHAFLALDGAPHAPADG
jgi:hypothetical protein